MSIMNYQIFRKEKWVCEKEREQNKANVVKCKHLRNLYKDYMGIIDTFLVFRV